MALQNTLTGQVERVTQIGVEVTPGTPVPATIRLASGAIELSPQKEFQNFRPPGMKFDTKAAKTREWSSGSFSGGLTYNELHRILDSAARLSTPVTVSAEAWVGTSRYEIGDLIVELVATVPTAFRCVTPGTSGAVEPAWPPDEGDTIGDGGSSGVTWENQGPATGQAFRRVYSIDTFARDDVRYYTVERGATGSGRVRRASRVFGTGFEISSSVTGETELSADFVGGKLIGPQGISLTPNAVMEEIIPATPDQLDVFIDTSAATFGQTWADGNFSGNIAISDRAAAVFFHGRRYPGIAGRVEGSEMGAECSLTQKDDDLVDELLLALDNGDRSYIRYDFVGPEIADTGINHRIIVDMAAQIGDADDEEDEDGVFARSLPFRLQHDSIWNRAFRIEVVNGVAA